MEHRIEEFDPTEAKENRTWLIIAPRGSGKTILLKDLLYNMRNKIDMPVAMTATESTVECFRQFMPHSLVHDNGYNHAIAEAFLNKTKESSKKGKKRNACMTLDDVICDGKVMKSEVQTCLHLNGRHYNTSLFNTTQCAMITPPAMRSNVDHAFCLQDSVLANGKRLHEHFFGNFGKFADFNRVFNEVTKDHGALVLDKTQSSGTMEDSVKCHRASIQTPEFRLGKSIHFRLDLACKKLKVAKKKEETNTMSTPAGL